MQELVSVFSRTTGAPVQELVSVFSRTTNLLTSPFYLSVVLSFFDLNAGPYQINGVPLRRVNQAYVIATSMKVDTSGVTIPVEDDSYFAREEQPKKTAEDDFFEQASKVSGQNRVKTILFREKVWEQNVLS